MPAVSDQLLFITWGRGEGGSEDFRGDHVVFRGTGGGSVVANISFSLRFDHFFLFNVILFYNSLCD